MILCGERRPELELYWIGAGKWNRILVLCEEWSPELELYRPL